MSILLDSILHSAINPAMRMLPPKMDSDAARVMLLSIGLQESRFLHRAQIVHGKPGVKGPARSYWQLEAGGGVAGVMRHDDTREHAAALCRHFDVPFEVGRVHASIEFKDVLAAGFARLLLWADPLPLPPVDADHETAWKAYISAWRPGKPHRHTWDEFHAQARAQVLL